VVVDEVATLVANVVDPDGDLDRVTIEWGDGAIDTVTSGFPGVRLDHTYTDDGDFTIVLEARGVSGQSVIATTEASITAFAAAAEAAAAEDDGSGSGTGSSRTGVGSGGGSSQPAPAPAPAPAPSPEPEPIPQPVTLDLMDDEVDITLDVRPPTGAGASAETEERRFGFGIRSYAWHGLDGNGHAEGRFERVIDASAFLAEMPEEVTAVTAEVSYMLDAVAEVKGPYDRTSTFYVRVPDLQGGGGTTLESLTARGNDADPIKITEVNQHTGTLVATLTRDEPEADFIAVGMCTSTSGSQIIGFFNEGYCDALEQGGLELRALSVTFIPIFED